MSIQPSPVTEMIWLGSWGEGMFGMIWLGSWGEGMFARIVFLGCYMRG